MIRRYRYWLVNRDESILHPFSETDHTKWERETVARCRHNPDHIPPVPDCTCGLYAMILPDLLYAVQSKLWVRQLTAYAEFRHHSGSMTSYVLFGQHAAREWLDSLPVPVIGEVELSDAIESRKIQPSGHETRAWRARRATIRQLYVSEGQESLAEALEGEYGVPCSIGYPTDYSRRDWEERRSPAGRQVSSDSDQVWPSFEELGIHPPEH